MNYIKPYLMLSQLNYIYFIKIKKKEIKTVNKI